jgi:hypothetical protein
MLHLLRTKEKCYISSHFFNINKMIFLLKIFFSHKDGGGGKNFPKGCLGMRMKFYLTPYRDSIPEHFIKIIFKFEYHFRS